MSEDPKYIESCRGVIKFLEAAVKNMAVYPPEHPSVKGVSQRAYDHLVHILQGKDEISLGIVNGVLFVDEYHFNEATPYSQSFLKTLNSFEIDDLVISGSATQDDVSKFAGILTSTDHGRETFLSQAEEAGLTRIGLKGILVAEIYEDPAVKALDDYNAAVGTVAGLFNEVTEGRLPVLEEVVRVVEDFINYLSDDAQVLLLLPSLKGYDQYTEQHCVNVSLLAMLLAWQEGLEGQDIRSAALAGLMHDAGMVKVPSHVTGKPGSLTLGERETFKSHPVHSAGIVHGMGGPDEVVYAVERHHVHTVEGGYPPGLENSQDPPLAGIVSVADFYDAVTALRPYKKAMDPVQALALLEKGSGTRFDPQLVDAFKLLTGPWPPGTFVRLTSCEIGIVIRKGSHPGRPMVKMLVDENGTVLADRWDLDLGADEVQGRRIAGVVDPALHDLTPEMAFG